MSQEMESLLQQLTAQQTLVEQESLRTQLTDYINYLLIEDFSRLVQLLYRVDISEQKLKQLLREHPQTDAAVLITDLLLQRQEEKNRTRKSFTPDKDIPEEEKW